MLDAKISYSESHHIKLISSLEKEKLKIIIDPVVNEMNSRLLNKKLSP